jgi:hypothetical protein
MYSARCEENGDQKMGEKMKTQLAMSLWVALFSGAAMAADLKVIECTGKYEIVSKKKTTEYQVRVQVVSGKPLNGGVAEVGRSSAAARFALVGHYLTIAKEGPAAGSEFTVYQSKDGFKLSIPALQKAHLPAGTYEGTLGLDYGRDAIPVICEDK